MKTQEEIMAQIEVLEKIGGYSIEVEALERECEKADSIRDWQVEAFQAGRKYNSIEVAPGMLQLNWKYKTFEDFYKLGLTK